MESFNIFKVFPLVHFKDIKNVLKSCSFWSKNHTLRVPLITGFVYFCGIHYSSLYSRAVFLQSCWYFMILFFHLTFIRMQSRKPCYLYFQKKSVLNRGPCWLKLCYPGPHCISSYVFWEHNCSVGLGSTLVFPLSRPSG